MRVWSHEQMGCIKDAVKKGFGDGETAKNEIQDK